MRLVTIPISHYCERARWALDHAGLAFDEDPHLQMFHYPYARRIGGGRSVPVLVTDEGTVLSDSADIVRFADALAPDNKKLYEDTQRDETIALEAYWADTFGVETRRVMYYHLFDWGRRGLTFNNGTGACRAPIYERWAGWLGFPLARKFIVNLLEVNETTMLAGRDLVERTFDDVAERLSDGRPFLMGDRFTAADLTFACMAAAVTSPPNYATRLPEVEEFPAEVGGIIAKYRAHPAGAHALRMFVEQRRS